MQSQTHSLLTSLDKEACSGACSGALLAEEVVVLKFAICFLICSSVCLTFPSRQPEIGKWGRGEILFNHQCPACTSQSQQTRQQPITIGRSLANHNSPSISQSQQSKHQPIATVQASANHNSPGQASDRRVPLVPDVPGATLAP